MVPQLQPNSPETTVLRNPKTFGLISRSCPSSSHDASKTGHDRELGLLEAEAVVRDLGTRRLERARPAPLRCLRQGRMRRNEVYARGR